MARSRHFRSLGLAGLLLLLAGCASDGHFSVLGYTTKPPFDPNIQTVYVPIFGNESFARGLEFELTKAVIRDIESMTPYKVTSNRDAADTILEGKIKNRSKGVNNINQLGEVRDVQMGLLVEVQWKDLRTDRVLSVPNGMRPKDRDHDPFRDPQAPPSPWVQITPSASYIPELGGTTSSATDMLARQVARQITHMMEVWNVNCAP